MRCTARCRNRCLRYSSSNLVVASSSFSSTSLRSFSLQQKWMSLDRSSQASLYLNILFIFLFFLGYRFRRWCCRNRRCSDYFWGLEANQQSECFNFLLNSISYTVPWMPSSHVYRFLLVDSVRLNRRKQLLAARSSSSAASLFLVHFFPQQRPSQ